MKLIFVKQDLYDLVKQKDVAVFKKKFQNQQCLLEGVSSNASKGLTKQQVEINQQKYGSNQFDQVKQKSYFRLFFDAFNDNTMKILLVAAIVSFVLTTTLISPKKLEWIDSVAIFAAILTVATISASNSYAREKQFKKLNDFNKNQQVIRVIRNGKQKQIFSHQIVVGDICLVSAGDKLPSDGILISCSQLKTDESSITGESDEVEKRLDGDIFLIGSCLVSSGSGCYVTTAVGKNTIFGEIQQVLFQKDLQTPQQRQLNDLSKKLSLIGSISSLLTFTVLVIQFYFNQLHLQKQNYMMWINYLILSITIIVVAVPEGLPLSIAISIGQSVKKMLQDQCLVRKQQACETMGYASHICVDKTGTLTENRMMVKHIYFGELAEFQQKDFCKLKKQEHIKQQLKILKLASCLCSTTQINKKNQSIIGNPTEGALLQFTQEVLQTNIDKLRQKMIMNDDNTYGYQFINSFNSQQKYMMVCIKYQELINNESNKKFMVLVKGAPEILLQKCSYILINNVEHELKQEQREQILKSQIEQAFKQMRTIAIAYKYTDNENDECDLIFSALVSISDNLRFDVKRSIQKCAYAGIKVTMVTGDNIHTAFAVCKESGIIKDQIITLEACKQKKQILEGSEFQKLTDQQLDKYLKHLKCVARASPMDKHRLVCRLKANQCVVVATGDGANDAPQLKAAHVGLSMGSGTEIAKEASSMVLLNNNFNSILLAVQWGRTVHQNIKKFLQFCLTAYVVTLFVTVFSAIMLDDSPFNPQKLLFINLIMNSFGAMALSTEQPDSRILKSKPSHPAMSIITPQMLRNIVIVSIFQIMIIVTMLSKKVGYMLCQVPQPLVNLLKIDRYRKKVWQGLIIKYQHSVVYNFFIFAQVFNLYNSRTINNSIKLKFTKVTINFVIIISIILILQVLTMRISILNTIFDIYYFNKNNYCKHTPKKYQRECVKISQQMSARSWAVSVGLALFTVVIHVLGRLFIKLPDHFKLTAKTEAKYQEQMRMEQQQDDQDRRDSLIVQKNNYEQVNVQKVKDKKQKGNKQAK